MPKDKRELIRTHEKSMTNFTKEWDALKKSGTSQLEKREQMLSLLRGAKDDLVGIINSLERAGIYLDYHYIYVRDRVANL